MQEGMRQTAEMTVEKKFFRGHKRCYIRIM